MAMSDPLQNIDFDIDDLLRELDIDEDELLAEFRQDKANPPSTDISLPDTRPESDAEPVDPNIFNNDIEFDISFHGYDRVQVEDYLIALTKDYNAICQKCDALEQENEGLRRALSKLGENTP